MNENAPLDELYFQWLSDRVQSVNVPPAVLKKMFVTPFNPFIPNDQNRAQDGFELRLDFLDEVRISTKGIEDWLGLDCSIFEMLLALANRAAFESSVYYEVWFDIFLRNLGLTRGVNIDRALERLNQRTYFADGKGGLFPLTDPKKDQRYVEVWYQMSAYLLENNLY